MVFEGSLSAGVLLGEHVNRQNFRPAQSLVESGEMKKLSQLLDSFASATH